MLANVHFVIIKMLLNGCTCNLRPTLTFIALFHIDPHLQLDLLKERTEGIGDLADPARDIHLISLLFSVKFSTVYLEVGRFPPQPLRR